MHKNNRLFLGRKWIALFSVMILMLTVVSLPLQAKNPAHQKDGGIMGEVRDGLRKFGRDASDALTPDNNPITGDGLMPDGSIDDGLANDGSQNTPDNGGILPGVTSTDNNNGAVTTPDSPTETTNDATPGTEATGPSTSAPTTTAQVTTNNAGDSAQQENGGFRWSGLIIALVIAAAVVLVVILIVSKKKG